MVDDLEREAVPAHVFLCHSQVLRIHHEGDLGSLSRAEPFKMGDFGRIEGCELLRAFQRYDILNAINFGDGLVCPGEEPAALAGGELFRMGDHVVEDGLWNDEISHDS